MRTTQDLAYASQDSKRSRARSSSSGSSIKPFRRYRTVAPTKVFTGRQPFPKQLFNTLKYSETIPLNIVTGFSVYRFIANGMFDPNGTGTGHQPLYYDQLMAVYDHYTVLKSRIRVLVHPNSTNTSPWQAIIYLDDDASTYTDPVIAAEATQSCKLQQWVPAATACPPLYLSFNAAKQFGPNPQAQDSLQGDASSNPSEISTYVVLVKDSALATSTITIVVSIEFDVVWDEFKTIAQS